MRHVIPICLLALAACGDPQKQCVTRANAELRAIDYEIAEIETALARGYRVQEGSRTTVGFALCTSDNPVHLCLSTERPINERRIAIDPVAERARLRRLEARRPAAETEARRAEVLCTS